MNSLPEPPGYPKCAPEVLFSALTSNLMFGSHIFILIVIITGLFTTVNAFRIMWKHSVFASSAKVILWFALLNGLVHMITMGVIRFKALLHAVLYFNDPCSIQFLSSDCLIDNYAVYTTNVFAACCLVSLFLDRLFSFKKRSFYFAHQVTFSSLFMLTGFIGSVFSVYWVFHTVPFNDYVPMCSYPPKQSLGDFYFVGALRMWAIGFSFLASGIILYCNAKRDKGMIHHVFNTDERFNSYENLLTTGAVTWVLFTQIGLLGLTSLVVNTMHRYRQLISDETFTYVVSVMAGTTYSAAIVPVIIHWKTVQIVRRRTTALGKLQMTDNFEDYFASLDEQWGRQTYKVIKEKTSAVASN